MTTSDQMAFRRRLVALLSRQAVEDIVKLTDPNAKPWLSNLPYLRDRVALAVEHNPEAQVLLMLKLAGKAGLTPITISIGGK